MTTSQPGPTVCGRPATPLMRARRETDNGLDNEERSDSVERMHCVR